MFCNSEETFLFSCLIIQLHVHGDKRLKDRRSCQEIDPPLPLSPPVLLRDSSISTPMAVFFLLISLGLNIFFQTRLGHCISTTLGPAWGTE